MTKIQIESNSQQGKILPDKQLAVFIMTKIQIESNSQRSTLSY